MLDAYGKAYFRSGTCPGPRSRRAALGGGRTVLRRWYGGAAPPRPSAGERERRPDPERSGSGRAILRYTGAEAGAPLGI